MATDSKLQATGYRLRALDSAKSVYKEVLQLKFEDYERYGLQSQIHRCAISIGSNIVEGKGRRNDKELKRFLDISIASARELSYQLGLYEVSNRKVPDSLWSILSQCIGETVQLRNSIIPQSTKPEARSPKLQLEV